MPFAFFLAALAGSVHAQSPLQSALDARGDAAGHILEITWVLFAGGTLIFVAVLALGWVALSGRGRLRDLLTQRRWIVAAGIVFPVVVLSALLIYTLGTAAAMGREQRTPSAARIHVAGELWWWRVRYLGATGETLFETANELRIPVGAPVDLELVSNDVIHSFWVPNLAGKMDMIPGHVNRLRLRAREPGVFRGQCAEYCGAQHARMAFHVVALPPEDYAAWLAAQQRPAAAATDGQLRQGQALFAEKRCNVCHAVRGTDAAGTLGPDLTHVAGRLTLAAGTLRNGDEAMAEWIARSQHFKPGVRMPAYPQLAREDLLALAAWLGSLQ